MLLVTVPAGEMYNEDTKEFVQIPETKLRLEHSLVSLAKWESKWKKPFLSTEKTREMTVDYIRCMNLTQNVDPNVFTFISDENIRIINEYIDDPMTATWFNERNKERNSRPEVITAEIIYYWMIALQIPVDFQKWHLNRLLTLVRVCNIKNAPKEQMSAQETIAMHRALNAARRKKK